MDRLYTRDSLCMLLSLNVTMGILLSLITACSKSESFDHSSPRPNHRLIGGIRPLSLQTAC